MLTYGERKKKVRKKTYVTQTFFVKDKSNTFYANFLMMKGEKSERKSVKEVMQMQYFFPGKICRKYQIPLSF